MSQFTFFPFSLLKRYLSLYPDAAFAGNPCYVSLPDWPGRAQESKVIGHNIKSCYHAGKPTSRKASIFQSGGVGKGIVVTFAGPVVKPGYAVIL